MSLPTLAEFKAYTRTETDAEDALMERLLTVATQTVEGYIGMPITARAFTWTDDEGGTIAPRALVLPHRPVDVAMVVSASGTVVDPDTYRVDAGSGIIFGRNGWRFHDGPYTVEYAAGLSLRADYPATEALVGQLVLDIAVELYQQRTPRAHSETGAGTTVVWEVSRELAARTEKAIRHLKLAVAR